DQVTTVVTNIRTLYSSQPNYNGITTEIAIKIGAIPTEMLNGQSTTTATTIINAFNGTVDIGFEGGGEVFTIEFKELGRNACKSLATIDWGASGSGLHSMGIIAEGITWHYPKDGIASISKATSACKLENNNSIVWMYY
ncbi:MAG: hypothetical protein IKV11_01485, partial [Alphaproteobacteria bacterium]|nr:hypothetical protein [Alphaproteobacteria bacterium]